MHSGGGPIHQTKGKSMNTVPLWVVASLGKQVRLKVDHWPDPRLRPYGAGDLVKLQSIEAGEAGPYAVCQMEPDDRGDLENFAFEDIGPVPGILGSFDMERGLIHQA